MHYRTFGEHFIAFYQRKSLISLGKVAPQLALLSSSEIPILGLEKQFTFSESELDFTNNLRILSQLHVSLNRWFFCQQKQNLTPISGRAGLVQWVDYVTRIYSVYKSWQHRVQAAQVSVVAFGNGKNLVQEHLPRSTEMFHAKIIPALKEKGIRRVISKKDRPHELQHNEHQHPFTPIYRDHVALQDPNVKKGKLRLLLLMILHEETRNGWRLVIYSGKVGEISHVLSKYFEYIWNYSSVISSVITSSISIPHHHQLGNNVGNGKNINEKKVDEWDVASWEHLTE
ncbi:hypothetical protein Tco_0917874 [Tanacetum coccineum]